MRNLRYLNFLILVTFVKLNYGRENLVNLVKEINSIQLDWQAEENKFTYLDSSELKRLLGLKVKPNKEFSSKHYKHIEVPNDLPKEFDARTQWPKCTSISSVKDQANCGSCWAVATAAAMSDRLCISSNFKKRFNLSAEALMTCCTKCTGGDPGCEGGYLDEAWKYWKWHGLVTGGDYGSKEGCQPYKIKPCNECSEEAATPACVKNKCTNKHYKKPYKKDIHKGKQYYYVPQNASQIQAEIFKNGPLISGFVVYKDFMSYKSGVYKHTKGENLGLHAVRIIGWGIAKVKIDVENRKKKKKKTIPYWLVSNSWGTSWGDEGTFKILRGKNECHFEDNVIAGVYSSSLH